MYQFFINGLFSHSGGAFWDMSPATHPGWARLLAAAAASPPECSVEYAVRRDHDLGNLCLYSEWVRESRYPIPTPEEIGQIRACLDGYGADIRKSVMDELLRVIQFRKEEL